MTPDDIIEMARQAGMRLDKHNGGFVDASELKRLVKLVDDKATAREREAFAAHAVDIARRAVAQEREACAKEADKWSKRDDDVGAFIGKAIRARGEA